MQSPVLARSVSAFGHTYTLDFTAVVLGGGLYLYPPLAVAVLGLRTLSSHADRQNLGRAALAGEASWPHGFWGRDDYLGLPVEMFSALACLSSVSYADHPDVAVVRSGILADDLDDDRVPASDSHRAPEGASV